MGMLWPTLETHARPGDGDCAVDGRARGAAATASRVGSFVAFNTYMVQLTWPIIALGWVINIFQRGTASMGRIRVDSRGAAGDHRCGGASDRRTDRSRRRDRVSRSEFPLRQYAEGDGARAATRTAMSGAEEREPARSGRHQPGDRGADRLGQIDTGHPDSANLRRRAGIGADRWTAGPRVPAGAAAQEYWLRAAGDFSVQRHASAKTLRLGRQEATDEEVQRAAEAANIAAEIEELSRGLQDHGGRARHYALGRAETADGDCARAVIRNPRILVLDDALSSVDTQTEDRILNHLREMMQGRTTIFISHRVSTVRNADRIAVLHEGRIVEYGHA